MALEDLLRYNTCYMDYIDDTYKMRFYPFWSLNIFMADIVNIQQLIYTQYTHCFNLKPKQLCLCSLNN